MQTDPLTELAAWIDANTTRGQFAKDVGCSESHLSNVLSGKKRASIELAEAIVRRTGGAMTANDLLSAEARRLIGEAAREPAEAAR